VDILPEVWQVAYWWLVAISLSAFGLGFMTLAFPAVKRAFFRAPAIVQKLIVPLAMVPLWVLPLAPQSRLTLIPLGAAL